MVPISEQTVASPAAARPESDGIKKEYQTAGIDEGPVRMVRRFRLKGTSWMVWVEITVPWASRSGELWSWFARPGSGRDGLIR